jgi:hypothetical protein
LNEYKPVISGGENVENWQQVEVNAHKYNLSYNFSNTFSFLYKLNYSTNAY